MWALFGLLAACADATPGRGEADSAAAAVDSGLSDSAAADSAPVADPAWFTPRAVVDLADGVLTISQLTLLVVDADLTTEICEIDVDPAAGAPGPPPDPAASVWVDVTVVAGDSDCAVLPSLIGLGIGEIPGDIRAQLGPSGLGDAADSLYGAFARAPDDSTTGVVAFGYAGTADDLAADDSATLPLPDGQYVLNPLFLIRIPEAGRDE